MIVERLEVRHFRRVRDVDLLLGPGLNVLYGPNDLGKSTLAEALRAALLLRSTAKEHERLVPWDDPEAAPYVRLTLRDAEGVRWRVRKRFGRSGAKGALLEREREGQMEPAAKGRGVDGILRERLRLGLPQPGGRGGPRGLPDTFLARALLGLQGEATDLFERGVEADPDDSGRAWLEETLAAYARDEAFDAALERARAEVHRAFTATGKRSGAAGSPFGDAAERVRQHQAKEREAREALEAATATRDALEHERRALEEAGRAVLEATARLKRARAREHAARLATLEDSIAEATRRVTALEDDARRRTELAEARRSARERIDTLRESVAGLEGELARAHAAAAIAEAGRAEEALSRARQAHGSVVARSRAVEGAVRLAELRTLREQVEAARAARAEAEALRQQAAARELEATALLARGGPDPAAMSHADDCARADEVARAQLQVGLRLALELGDGVDAYLLDDEGGARPTEAVLVARGRVRVELRRREKVLARLDARAGGDALHQRAEQARRAFIEALAPLREAHGIAGEGREALAALRTLGAEAAARAREAAERKAEASRLRERAAVSHAQDPSTLEARIGELEERIGDGAGAADLLDAAESLEALRRESDAAFGASEKALRDAERMVSAKTATADARRQALPEDSDPMAGDIERLTTAARTKRDALRAAEGALGSAEASAADGDEPLNAARAALVDLRARRESWLEAAPAPVPDPPGELPSGDEAARELEAAEGEMRTVRDEVARLEGRAGRSSVADAEAVWQRTTRGLDHARAAEREVELEHEGWRRLVFELEQSAARMGRDLGAALIAPVQDRFAALLEAVGGDVERYGGLALSSDVATEGAVVDGEVRELSALSMGTREQLVTLLRMTLAERLGSFLVLDDHLTHTDADRARVLSGLMREVARRTQVIVFTCHPERYLADTERATNTDALHAVDVLPLLRP